MNGTKSAEQERTHDANSPSPQQHDITPEVFRRFMSYERAQLAEEPTSTTTFADLGPPVPVMPSRNSYSSSRDDEPNQAQSLIPRMIRGMPRRSFDASAPSTASKPASASASRTRPAPSQATAGHDAVGSRNAAQQPRPPTGHAVADKDATVTPQSLSQDFQHLSVSASDSATHQSAGSGKRSNHGHSDDQFQFPSLPPKLTDDGFHYRQRAAQFILLCSQEATPDRLTKLNRLSLPLVPRSNASGQIRRGTGTSRLDDMDRHDDDESVHSHHDHHHASDDDSEYLDFDACRTAHLGNKKKRKSSRFSSPGLTTNTSSATNFDKSLQHGAHEGSGGSDRALVDRTNTVSQSYPQSTADRENQRNGDLLAYAKLELAAFRYPESARLPPRQSRGEYLMQRLRNRVRTRVASVLLQRRYAQMEAERQARREEQAKREAQLAQGKTDAETQQSASPERKAPPKRANKAGKRAQAIRGGNSASKPLTIAEIRARAAAAASGGGGAQNGTTAAKAQTQSSPSPARKGSSPTRSDAVKQETRDDKVETKQQQDTRRDSALSTPISKSRQQSPQPNGRLAPASQSKHDIPMLPPQSKVTLPTSAFDFRMSSAVTLRLRELRSQLDAATRNLSDTAKAGDTHAVAQALSETVAAPPTAAPVRSVDPPMLPADIPPIPPRGPNWDIPDDAPPWVRHALDYQYHLEQQQAKARSGGRSSAKTGPVPAAIPASHTAPPVQSRSGSSTPGRASHVHSPAPPPPPASSASAKPPPAVRTKAKPTNGRRTTTRKTDSHKHTSACKHGHPHSHGHSSGLGSALFTPDDWICLFCEYELYYGEPPLMLRACRNRKKLVEKKSKAKNKAQAALSKKNSKANGTSNAAIGGDCGHHHEDYSDHGCEHACCHDHGSVTSDDHHHHHHHHHHGEGEGEGGRERCDCGNSIHSSDFDEEHH